MKQVTLATSMLKVAVTSIMAVYQVAILSNSSESSSVLLAMKSMFGFPENTMYHVFVPVCVIVSSNKRKYH